jgi:hypothetical protein
MTREKIHPSLIKLYLNDNPTLPELFFTTPIVHKQYQLLYKGLKEGTLGSILSQTALSNTSSDTKEVLYKEEDLPFFSALNYDKTIGIRFNIIRPSYSYILTGFETDNYIFNIFSELSYHKFKILESQRPITTSCGSLLPSVTLCSIKQSFYESLLERVAILEQHDINITTICTNNYLKLDVNDMKKGINTEKTFLLAIPSSARPFVFNVIRFKGPRKTVFFLSSITDTRVRPYYFSNEDEYLVSLSEEEKKKVLSLVCMFYTFAPSTFFISIVDSILKYVNHNKDVIKEWNSNSIAKPYLTLNTIFHTIFLPVVSYNTSILDIFVDTNYMDVVFYLTCIALDPKEHNPNYRTDCLRTLSNILLNQNNVIKQSTNCFCLYNKLFKCDTCNEITTYDLWCPNNLKSIRTNLKKCDLAYARNIYNTMLSYLTYYIASNTTCYTIIKNVLDIVRIIVRRFGTSLVSKHYLNDVFTYNNVTIYEYSFAHVPFLYICVDRKENKTSIFVLDDTSTKILSTNMHQVILGTNEFSTLERKWTRFANSCLSMFKKEYEMEGLFTLDESSDPVVYPHVPLYLIRILGAGCTFYE